MSEQRPTVSIVLPTYNGGKYVRDSIVSCLNQTFNDFELIVVNDCSTDNTPEVVEQFAHADSRVKVIHNETNKKLPTSLNVGFSQALGKYHTWTSDDNAYAPTALEEMVHVIESQASTDIVYCDYVKIDDRTGMTRDWVVRDIDLMGRGNPVGACFLYRSEVFNQLNGYNEELFCVEDYDFWLRAYRSGFKYTPLHKKLYLYRCHGESLTETRKEQIQLMTSKLNEAHFRLLDNEMKSGKSALYANKTDCPSENKVAIWGWWQGQNLGDNWIKETLKSFFPKAAFVDTTQQDFRNYDFVICGGGGLFIRDVIAPWKGPIQTPFGILGLGAEFAHPNNTANELSQKADFFYVRDEYSVTCMKSPPETRSYDLTFARPLSTNREPDMNRALFVWRDPDQLLAYPDFKQYIGPTESYTAWRKNISSEFVQVDEDDFNTRRCEIEKLISDAGFVISGRYHGIVAAIQKGIPCIGIDLCPKIRSLMREAGLEEYCLKAGETGAVRHLIRKAKKDYMDIQQKQVTYCQKAHAAVIGHIKRCHNAIDKRLSKKPAEVFNNLKYQIKDNCLSAALN